MGGRKCINLIGKGEGPREANTGERQRLDTEIAEDEAKEAAAQSDSSGYLLS